MNILYLHGFRSSPQSSKATMLRERFAPTGHRYLCPQLPASPRAAIELACELIEERGEAARDWALVGSSLGGYYATHLAERYGCRAVLLNPAITPAEDLADYVGELTNFHDGTPFYWRAEYLDELAELAVERITRPERYLLIAAKGDELIDWRDMVAHYPGAQQIVLDGSDHALSDFARYVETVVEFCERGTISG
ncbi:MAG: alpha/beta fold hydrolase [Casimicrobiaceae bacterium]|nr:alpha/beta fold hydrolase [Casimicrobiaceae bacterium]MDW8312894.1 YqiA/YcfP family alpha/beta fold hydrolase [Burkholderiales bacterium]